MDRDMKFTDTFYTEAHFAACLLECGPHCKLNEHGSGGQTAYCDRVYQHFIALFPSYRDVRYNPEWNAFWCEYRAWVES